MKKVVIEKDVLEQMWRYENKTLSFISKTVGYSPKTVQRIIKEYNLERCYKCSEWLYQKHYVEKLSCKQMAEEAHCSVDTIYDWMKQHDLKVDMDIIHSSKKKYTENDNFFDEIDTENKAYWLGFIMADGHIADKVTIALSIKDKEHLELFLRDIQSTRKPYTYIGKIGQKEYKMCRISISSRHMLNSLKELGFVSNKSLKEFIPDIPSELMNHFIRGYFDGDGSLNYGVNKNDAEFINATMLGGKEYLENISTLLSKQGITSFIYNKSGQLYNLVIKKSDVYDFFEWLYADATVFLQRKYERYQNLFPCKI